MLPPGAVQLCLAWTYHTKRIDCTAAKSRNLCFQREDCVNNAVRFPSCASFLVVPSWPSDTTTKARSFYQYLGVGSCTNSVQTPRDGDRKGNYGSHILRNSEQQTEQLRASGWNDRKFAYTCSKSADNFFWLFYMFLCAPAFWHIPRCTFVGCHSRVYFYFCSTFLFFRRNTNATCKTSIPAPPFDPFFINLHSFVPVLSFLVHLHLV